MRVKVAECTTILDSQRIPLSSAERENLERIYPYYGAQGIIDYVDNYIFDGEYILIAEDGNNLKSLSMPIATWATGKFWVNNHAHILGEKKGVCLKYIYYVLNSLDLRGYITGSAQPKFNQENLSRVELDIPDYNTQCKIANVLDIIDSKISLNNSICSDIESMAKLLYDYWFVQFDFPDENGKPYKSSGGKMVWNEELKREVPEGWKIWSLGDHMTSMRGVSYSTPDLSGDGVPMLNLACFSPDDTYKASGIKNFSGIYEDTKILQPYELIMCNTQQTALDPTKDIIGHCLLVPDIFDSVVVSSHHVNHLIFDKVNLNYLVYGESKTLWFHKYMTGLSSGTNILGMDFNGVYKYKMVMPNENILCKFAEIIHNIEAKKNEIIKENRQLSSLRDFLLPMLMNGQVKVGKEGE